MERANKSVQSSGTISGVPLPTETIPKSNITIAITLIKAKGHEKQVRLSVSPQHASSLYIPGVILTGWGQRSYAFPVYLFKLEVASKWAAQTDHPEVLWLFSFQSESLCTESVSIYKFIALATFATATFLLQYRLVWTILIMGQERNEISKLLCREGMKMRNQSFPPSLLFDPADSSCLHKTHHSWERLAIF